MCRVCTNERIAEKSNPSRGKVIKVLLRRLVQAATRVPCDAGRRSLIITERAKRGCVLVGGVTLDAASFVGPEMNKYGKALRGAWGSCTVQGTQCGSNSLRVYSTDHDGGYFCDEGLTAPFVMPEPLNAFERLW